MPKIDLQSLALLEKFLTSHETLSSMEEVKEKFKHFLTLLEEQNNKVDLTALSPSQWETDHLLDSLTCLSLLTRAEGKSVVDIGSGAGFPGIPLAICLPSTKFTLVESSEKRALFLRIVQRELALSNVDVISQRAEDVARSNHREGFEFVTARAVAELRILLELAAPLLKLNGKLLAMKGKEAKNEVSACLGTFNALNMQMEEILSTVEVPNKESRHIIVAVKRGTTEERFPRTPKAMKVRPL